jgi:hypothetical protein
MVSNGIMQSCLLASIFEEAGLNEKEFIYSESLQPV